MEYVAIGLCLIAIIAVGVILYQRKKKEAPTESFVPSTVIIPAPAREGALILPAQEDALQEISIHIEMLPAEVIPEGSKLAEITDSKVLAHVNQLVPNLAQAGNAVNNAVQAVQANGEVLYRAIIPAGAKLANSRDMAGAARGIFHGADGIRGHANLVAVEAQKGTAVVANTAAAAMGVASMVVGQYYMTQINSELEKIGNGISKVSDFQDNEYRSRVFSLVNHVKKIAAFQAEIIENDELRFSKISQLDNLEEECTKLLGQANLTLAGFANKSDLDYEAYELELHTAQNWFIYQTTLLEILCRISDLRYALHLGAVSREHCIALLPTYTHQVAQTQAQLTKWHKETIERLSVDTTEARRKRDGLDRAIHFIPGLFDDTANFRPISKSTAKMIDSQSIGNTTPYLDESDLYAHDVQLIAKNGKIYYLPTSTVDQ